MVDGPAATARFSDIGGLAFDSSGNLYVAGGYRVRKISAAGVVSTIAGGGDNYDANESAPDKAMLYPFAITLDAAGNLYIAESQKLRRLTPQGVLSTLFTVPSGDGVDGRSSGLYRVGAIGVDGNGNIFANNRIGTRKVSPTGSTTILEGVNDQISSGTASFLPRGLVVGAAGELYTLSLDASTIVKVDPSGNRTTLAGKTGSRGHTDGPNGTATLDYSQMAADGAGNLYLVPQNAAVVRKVSPTGAISTIAGTFDGTTISLDNLPGVLPPLSSIAVSANGDIYVSTSSAILKIKKP